MEFLIALTKGFEGSRSKLSHIGAALIALAGVVGMLPCDRAIAAAAFMIALGGFFQRLATANATAQIGDIGEMVTELLKAVSRDPKSPRDPSDDPPSVLPFKAALFAGLLLLPISSEIATAQQVTRQRVCDGRRCYWVDVVTPAATVPAAPNVQIDTPARPLPKAPSLDYPKEQTSMRLSAETRSWFRNPDGSCVQCSIGMCGVHANDPNAASLLWDSEHGRAERGGSWPSRVEAYCDRRGIRAWSITGNTVDDTLPWCAWAAATGRFAAIGAGTAHFQTLYGYDPESREWMVCNNNTTNHIDRYDHDSFRRLHAASGPWVVVLEKASSDPPRPVKWWK